MTTKKDSTPLPVRVQSSFNKLKAAASELNSASDRITKLVGEIDAVLKPLNIGIDTWVQIGSAWCDENLNTGYNEVGYSKVNGKWGISLRSVTENPSNPFDDIVEWSFGDGPRRLRLESIDYLPPLLDELAKKADDGTRELNDKTSDLESFVSALKGDQK
jgi:uncharacterized protein YukE